MNARTCLLCGKALSRIWVGAGEDFCSREHRNQYRLRRGMDRLLEANKVANLIRRREQPKPISPILQAGNSSARLPDSASARFSARRMTLAWPSSRWEPPVRIPGERGPVVLDWSRLAEPKAREFGILRQAVRSVVLSARSRTMEPPGANYLERTRRPKPIKTEGRHGNALRVSAGAGFRLPAKRGRHLPTPRHTGAGMRWPDRPIVGETSAFDRRRDPKFLKVLLPVPQMCNPQIPEPAIPASMNWPGAVAPARRRPAGSTLPDVRDWGAFWSNGDAMPPRPIPHGGQRRAAADLVRVPQRLTYGSGAKQIAVVSWTTPDSPLGVGAKVNGAEPTKNHSPARLEERFDGGFKNWLGGTDDWFVDAAGVRTGLLALYRPSLEMRDYEMEFLTRIENQSVTWVFRASNLREYYIASIGVAPGGGYEFWRGSVMGGVAEPDVAVPLVKPPGPKTAVTIRMRVVGKDFAVWMDGQSIDHWSDNRLAVGGIGFVAAPDDRARIYWVTLSQAGAPVKE